MRLYRSQGRVWTGTQADAKTAQGGKDFEEIEVPTDKAGLMKFLNEFDVRPGERAAEVEAPPAAEAMPAYPEDVVGTRIVTSAPAASADDCPACLRSRRVAKLTANSTAAVSIKADLEDVSDVRSIKEIIRLAKARQAEIEGDRP